MAQTDSVRFGTFAGVYRPVVLTVLGALLYLREGWLVGNAGLFGALCVIVAAYAITGTTAMAVSSIATNIRVKAGGAFAIIAAALGLEAGGAIGIPLYLAQTISSVMYLFAFSEGWSYLFPNHPAWLVVGVAFLAVGAVVLLSARLAARAQAVMLAVVIAALGSAFGGWFTEPTVTPRVLGDFSDASVLSCFALFFPAATGIMVGAGMSGSLERPARSIPKGTMAAWATTFAAYVVGAFWYATVVPQEELLANKLAMVDHALVGELVLFGLLSSTLMAAMSCLVAAPRLLQAMADHDVVPGARWLRVLAPNGEPRVASLVTLGVAAVALSAGSLDAIAPVITSFFVMTYLAINVVVALEQGLGLVSWRPTFLIPIAVPVVGALACVLGLILSSPAGGLPEVLFVLGIYVWLSRRKRLDTPWETVQSGIAQTVAAWAALKAAQMGKSERTWKPDLLVPVANVAEAEAAGAVAAAIIAFRGSVKFVATRPDPKLEANLENRVQALRNRGDFASWHRMPEESPGQGARLSLNAMQGTFFAPNLVLLSARHVDPEALQGIVDHAVALKIGVVLSFDGPGPPIRAPRAATVWLSDRAPDWELSLHVANLDLPVLLAYMLTRPMQGETHLATALRDEAHMAGAERFLADLVELGRLPNTHTHALVPPFFDRLREAPSSGVHILGLPDRIDLDRLQAIHEAAGAPCLFVKDSGQESALA
jgi:amino acid transporter